MSYESDQAMQKFWLIVIGMVILASVLTILFVQSAVEKKVWNRCHPDHEITQWEALWAKTRIDNCVSEKDE